MQTKLRELTICCQYSTFLTQKDVIVRNIQVMVDIWTTKNEMKKKVPENNYKNISTLPNLSVLIEEMDYGFE